ncbi:hypothetical protein ACFSQJ_15140 [Croceitalea marina]|uniref:Lipocalin-like domain-containing protein n=1 Tax=Croceitalea marina TaxID=1775166 RepID=A0ABW5N0C7_9FLAO
MKLRNNYSLESVIGMIIILSTIYGCAHKQEKIEEVKNKLIGSWRIDKVKWIAKDTTLLLVPNSKGLLLITDGHYSIAWSPREKRIPFKNLGAPTAEETIAGFQSIVFNSGVHESTDSTFTTIAQIAKVPGFEGGKQLYRYETKNDSKIILTLFDEYYPDNTKPNWSGKWKTEFYLYRE